MEFTVLRRNKDHVSPLTSKPLYLPTLPITSQVLGADPGLESTSLWASPSVFLTLPAYHTVTFVPPETAGALGTGSLKRYSHSKGGGYIRGRR